MGGESTAIWHRDRERCLCGLLLIGHVLSVVLEWSVVKAVLGLAAVGYVPGALLVRLMFRRPQRLSAVERCAMNVCSSLMLSTAIALVVNWSPMELRPGVTNRLLWGLTAVLLAADILLDKKEQSDSVLSGSRGIDPRERTVRDRGSWSAWSLILSVLAGLCLLLLLVLVLRAENGERYTEFYLARADPVGAGSHTGQPDEVIAAISNRTQATQAYHIEILGSAVERYRSRPVILPDRDTAYIPVPVCSAEMSLPAKVAILLYVDDEAIPLHALHLWCPRALSDAPLASGW